MSRSQRLGAVSALALLSTLGLSAGAMAASATQSGTAATMPGAQTSVGDTGNGNGAVLPENPSNLTDRAPASAQSSAGIAAPGGATQEGGAVMPGAGKQSPSEAGQGNGLQPPGGTQATNGSVPTGTNGGTAPSQTAGQNGGTMPPDATTKPGGDKSIGMIQRAGPVQGLPTGQPSNTQTSGQSAASADSQVGKSSGSIQPPKQTEYGANTEQQDQLFGTQQPPGATTTQNPGTTTTRNPDAAGVAGIPMVPKAEGEPAPLITK